MSSLIGASGAAAGPSSMLAPLPLAHQCVGATPLEKYRVAKRSGGLFGSAAAAVLESCALRSGSDSSQGSARATPAPRRKCRLVLGSIFFIIALPYRSFSPPEYWRSLRWPPECLRARRDYGI